MKPSTEMPGRELDALIAERVMGWRKIDDGEYIDDKGVDHHVGRKPYDCQVCGSRQTWFDPSTSIAAAWVVVEKLDKDKNLKFVLTYGRVAVPWTVGGIKDKWSAGFGSDAIVIWSSGETAPRAICLAALKAVGIEVIGDVRVPPGVTGSFEDVTD